MAVSTAVKHAVLLNTRKQTLGQKQALQQRSMARSPGHQHDRPPTSSSRPPTTLAVTRRELRKNPLQDHSLHLSSCLDLYSHHRHHNHHSSPCRVRRRHLQNLDNSLMRLDGSSGHMPAHSINQGTIGGNLPIEWRLLSTSSPRVPLIFFTHAFQHIVAFHLHNRSASQKYASPFDFPSHFICTRTMFYAIIDISIVEEHIPEHHHLKVSQLPFYGA